jgi:prephenate dehydrogenase
VRIAVIGLGLIGGSVALAFRQLLGARVSGWDADPSAVARAQERAALDFAAPDLQTAIADAEAVVLAAPLGALPRLIAAALKAAPADCVVTDVGSAKRRLEQFHADERFIGGHPLAGAETAGIEHARADLFEGATWYLTPVANTEGVLYERLYRLLVGIGAQPVAIEAGEHDRMLALISHLPHVLANVLVQQTAAGGEGGHGRLPATGPSFRDVTRVAGSNSAIWTDIYLSNADALTEALDATIARLTAARELIRAGDASAIRDWNELAARDRRRLVERQLADGPLHELRVAVPNRPGVVAELALALGEADVNITDMALYPAPDGSRGVVALWIVGDGERDRAEALIMGAGYTVGRP